ncbi:MAG: signal peptidase II [Candidatus Methylomirabilales bacterium]
MSTRSFYVIAITITVLDQFSKLLVQQMVRLGEIVSVIPSFFNLTYVLNPGAAFGFLARAPAAIRSPFFTAISILAALFIIYYRFRHPRMGLLPSLGLSFILGGAVGNLLDRLRLGMVVDFLDFYYGAYHWPAFNVADSAITVGVALMIVEIFTDRRKG